MRKAFNIVKDILCFVSVLMLVWMLNSFSIYYSFVPARLVIAALLLEALAVATCFLSIKKIVLGSLSVLFSLLSACLSIASYFKCNRGWVELRNFSIWAILFIIAPLLTLIAKHIDRKG